MTARGANGRVPKAVPHRDELLDIRVDIVGAPREHGAIDARRARGGEHAADFVE